MNPAITRRIDFHVLPGFQLLDLSGPLAAFEFAAAIVPGCYPTAVISESGDPRHGFVGRRHRNGAADEGAGHPDHRWRRWRPCGGGFKCRVGQVAGFAVAANGQRVHGRLPVGGGRPAGWAAGTTHWRHAVRLQAAYPQVRVDPDKIFIKDGPVWSSAGITAGIDLALALIEEDLGISVARDVARDLVVYHRRPGGQSQFSALLTMAPASNRIRAALQFARDHMPEKLPVERLADAARLSPRQFGRAFLAETGQTPAKAVERLRAEAARPGVEDGSEPLDEIARSVGFADAERMRQSFIRAFGQPPQALRRAARR